MPHCLLVLDVLTVKVLVAIARLGRDADLTPETHAFFADRYRRLADHHGRRGHASKARRFAARAEAHLLAIGPEEGPPFAAAMARPRPRHLLMTDAVSRVHFQPPNDAA